jgi:hypothetical protein
VIAVVAVLAAVAARVLAAAALVIGSGFLISRRNRVAAPPLESA